MNPNDEVQRNRLGKAIETSYRALEPFRWLTRGLVEEYAGSGYGRRGQPRHEIVINLMNQTVDAYTMALVANRPRVMLSTDLPERTYFSKHFQVALNNLIQTIGLEYTLRQWVLDAFFCVGVVKVHMASSGFVQLAEDMWVDPGKPFASNVGIDNWVHDTSATRWEHVQYAGDSYRIPFEDLKQSMFSQDVVADLAPSSKQAMESERLERLTRGEVVDDDELEPMIDLADIWVPRDGKIYTFPMDRRGQFQIKSKPVAVMDWDGPNHGPYHLLGFNDVPENIMPTSPASHLSSLMRLANNLMRKQKRQAMRQKEVTTYTPGGDKDAQRIQCSDDGEFIQVNDPSQIGQLKFGGVDGGNQAFLINVIEMYDRFAGNLTAMAGLGAQAPTASQEQLIQSRVSNREAQMQYRVLDGTSRLIRDLGFLLWNDKVQVIPGSIPIDGTDYSMNAPWTPDDREGAFFDYRIDIDVFSMGYKSPSERLTFINGLISQVYAPWAQQIAAQGGQINIQKLLEIHAELGNEPRLKEIIQFVNPAGQGDGEDSTPAPINTTRTYQRNSVSAGPTPQNRARMDSQAWMQMAQPSMNGNGAPH